MQSPPSTSGTLHLVKLKLSPINTNSPGPLPDRTPHHSTVCLGEWTRTVILFLWLAYFTLLTLSRLSLKKGKQGPRGHCDFSALGVREYLVAQCGWTMWYTGSPEYRLGAGPGTGPYCVGVQGLQWDATEMGCRAFLCWPPVMHCSIPHSICFLFGEPALSPVKQSRGAVN